MEKIEQVRLSPIEKKKLEDLCSNRLNWTDGGYWMGRGKEPNCSISINTSVYHIRTIKFPTDELANKWNDKMEQDIRLLTHTGSALTSILIFPLAPITSLVVGNILGIMQSEIIAAIGYPKMERGWSFEIHRKYEYFWSPHPFSPSHFIIHVKFISRNHLNEIKQEFEQTQKFKPDDLPQEMIDRVMATNNTNKTVIYQPYLK